MKLRPARAYARGMVSQSETVAAVRSYRKANGASIVAEFVELLALPNVSRNLDDVAVVADRIVGMLSQRGVAVRIETMPGAAPLVVGRLDVPGAERTIGIYAHYDGQPIDQPDWSIEPFKPTLVDAPLEAGGQEIPFPHDDDAIDPEWRIYARSTSDDKAPIMAVCAALDGMAAAGLAPSSNVVFLFEGEEEIGSLHLADYMAQLQDDLSADIWLICDGPVHQTRVPQVVFGVRGISEMEITAYGPARPLHSGHYGNWARNPNLELARLLASMKADDGTVLVAGFDDSTQPITESDRAAVALLPDDDEALRVELGLGDLEGAGEALALRLLRPSLNVRGFDGGAVGATAANVIPTRATASIDIRLAAGNDPVGMMELVVAHITGQGWHVVDDEPDAMTLSDHERVARITMKANYPGVRLPTDSALARSLVQAAAIAAGEPAIAVPTFGGSVPLHYFTTILGSPIAITPFANHDNNQHAANENIRIANLWYGVDLMASLMTIPIGAITTS